MYRNYCLNRVLAIGIVITLLLTNLVYTFAGEEDIFTDAKVKVDGISAEEKATLEKLFTQTQLIEEMEKRAAQTYENIQKTSGQIESLEKKIEDDKNKYQKECESLKQVLQCYQRMGPGSYLEILLKSNNLADLLMRINTLRDLTDNTGDLLDSIEEDRQLQSQEKAKLSEELLSVKDKQRSLSETLDKGKKLKEDLENYLASLSAKREQYEEYLGDLKQAWNGIAPFISDTAKELLDYSNRLSLPRDALKITLGFLTAKITIEEKTINDLLSSDPKLGKITFTFDSGKVTAEFPDKNLTITGKFVIKDGHSLRFYADGGSFYGMPLNKDAISELLKKDSFEIDLESQLEGNKLKSVDIMDGYLSITI